MKNAFLLFVFMAFNSHGSLITPTPSPTSAFSFEVSDDDITINSTPIATPTLLGTYTGDDSGGIVEEVVVTNPITGNPQGNPMTDTINFDLGNNTLDTLGGITVLPEPESVTLILLGVLLVRKRLRHQPSG